MPVSVRRALYGLAAILGFAMMVPLAVNMRRLQAELGAGAMSAIDPLTLDPATSAWMLRLLGLFLLGMCIAAASLYAALSTGYPRAWRPRENGEPSCQRCGAPLPFGIGRCPACGQQLIW